MWQNTRHADSCTKENNKPNCTRIVTAAYRVTLPRMSPTIMAGFVVWKHISVTCWGHAILSGIVVSPLVA